MVLSFVNEVIGVLADYKFLTVAEIQRITGLSNETVMQALKFMTEFGFVILDQATGSVALVLPLRELLKKIVAST